MSRVADRGSLANAHFKGGDRGCLVNGNRNGLKERVTITAKYIAGYNQGVWPARYQIFRGEFQINNERDT